MQSKNKRAQTADERRHLEVLAQMPCALCESFGPSEVHEIKQGQWFTSIPLCAECHRGPLMGLHGQKRGWALRKMDELDALAVTIKRLVC
jgi:hypothetical protein